MAAATATKPKPVHELLDGLDQATKRIGREADALNIELLALGAPGNGPVNVTATIPVLKAELAAARAEAVRKGHPADLAALDAKLAAATARVSAIGLESAACKTALADVARERVELIRARRVELDGLARQSADAIAELKRTARAAAADLLDAYRNARTAIVLASTALPPTPGPPVGVSVHPDELTAVAIADRENATAYRASYSLGDAEYWQAVERVASESVS